MTPVKQTIIGKLNNVLARIIGSRNWEKLLIYSAKSQNINLHTHGLIQIGAVLGMDSNTNGEKYFIENILPLFIEPNTKPVLFDVGANIGEYSSILRHYYPGAEIFSFEPVAKTFEILSRSTKGKDIKIFNIGLSDDTGMGELYNSESLSNNLITTAYREALPDLFNINDAKLIKFEKNTLDNFCTANDITGIDFLKIDVEGHELAVLKGAKSLLSGGKIKVLQFEFNAHNVYSRVFLRDFYQLLEGFDFFRLMPRHLNRLGQYNFRNEIFTLQNIIAVRADLTPLLQSRKDMIHDVC
jgi:FkbM family methyltransferase